MAEEFKVIQEDIRGIRRSLVEINETLRVVAIQGEKIATIEREIKDLWKASESAEEKIQSIRETCIARERIARLGEQHLMDDESAASFWARLVSSAATSGFWIVAGALVSALVGRLV